MNDAEDKLANRTVQVDRHTNLWTLDASLSFTGGGMTPEAARMTWPEIRESLAEHREGFVLSANSGEDRNT